MTKRFIVILSAYPSPSCRLDTLVPVHAATFIDAVAAISEGNVQSTASRRRLSSMRSTCDSWMWTA